MFEAAVAHAIDAIGRTVVHSDPFDHIYVEGVFPEDFYRTLQANLPITEDYERLADTARVSDNYNPERYFVGSSSPTLQALPREQRDFWTGLFNALHAEQFAHSALTKFGPTIKERFARQAGAQGMSLDVQRNSLLIRDLGSYALGPHTDSPSKLVAMLFYLPGTVGAAELGTSLYQPKAPSFTCDGTGRHYPFEHFDRVQTMAYQPNTLFAFAKTERSFHGVEPVPPETLRDLMLFDIRGE
jgi:hypothetical protein